MKQFKSLTKTIAQIIEILSILALTFLGILLVILMFKELLPLSNQLFAAKGSSSVQMLDDIVVFFLFFEFTTLVASAILHHGHANINFLMGLGITALIRGLITSHDGMFEILLSSAAVLLLTVSMAIYNKYRDED